MAQTSSSVSLQSLPLTQLLHGLEIHPFLTYHLNLSFFYLCPQNLELSELPYPEYSTL